jgi:hypothetical protein
MVRIDAALLYWMVVLFEQMKASCRLEGETGKVKEVHRKDFLRHIELARTYAEKLPLPLTQKQIDRLGKDVWENTGTYEHILDGLNNLTTRFSDELVLFHIPSERRDLFDHVRKELGEEVISQFPETLFDIEEGGKCLALGRGAACVFHLSRVLEVGLRYISREARKCHIECPDPSPTQSWDRWLDPIERELGKERKQKNDDWKAVKPHYAEIMGHLRTVSTAWRNPTLQGAMKYTVEEAQEIFHATREFMRCVASAKLS